MVDSLRSNLDKANNDERKSRIEFQNKINQLQQQLDLKEAIEKKQQEENKKVEVKPDKSRVQEEN